MQSKPVYSNHFSDEENGRINRKLEKRWKLTQKWFFTDQGNKLLEKRLVRKTRC